MSAATILALVLKGISAAQTVWDNRELALKALDAVKAIANRGKAVTQAEIDAVEADLDAMLEEFNAPLPPKT